MSEELNLTIIVLAKHICMLALLCSIYKCDDGCTQIPGVSKFHLGGIHKDTDIEVITYTLAKMQATAPLPPNVNRGPGIVIASWIEAGVALFVLSLPRVRLYTRSSIVRSIGWDDWTMVFATVSQFNLLYSVLALTFLADISSYNDRAHSYGGSLRRVGRHAAYLDPDNIINPVKMIWLTTPISTMSACFGKVSIALLLKRIINRNKIQVAFLWSLIISLLIVNLLLTIITENWLIIIVACISPLAPLYFVLLGRRTKESFGVCAIRRPRRKAACSDTINPIHGPPTSNTPPTAQQTRVPRPIHSQRHQH
jgi:hypothetical protein